MDCGAYKVQLNGGNAFSKYEEINQHIKQLNNFKTRINNKYVKNGLFLIFYNFNLFFICSLHFNLHTTYNKI
jgi:hypothetical protein